MSETKERDWRPPMPFGCWGVFCAMCFWWALWFGVPTTWGLFEIDLFPPGIFVGRGS